MQPKSDTNNPPSLLAINSGRLSLPLFKLDRHARQRLVRDDARNAMRLFQQLLKGLLPKSLFTISCHRERSPNCRPSTERFEDMVQYSAI